MIDAPDVTIRPAVQADAATIKRIVRSAGIKPFGLSWDRFMVAEYHGEIVATGQLKPHKDGTVELASIATIPTYQHKGIASRLVHALLERAPTTLYLECESRNEGFYARFGFHALTPDQMPPDLGREYRFVTCLQPAFKLFRIPGSVSIMKLDRS
jgi:N-acetylglutamate synthase-like GNAT family acetyltransferase